MTKTCVICKKQPIPGDSTRSFHKFPLNNEIKQKWMEVTGIQAIKKVSTVCSDHFEDESFHQTDGYTRIRRLLATAVPVLHRNNLIKQPSNVIPSSVVETVFVSSIDIDGTSGNIILDSSKSSNVSDVEVKIEPIYIDVAEDLTEGTVCDTHPVFPQPKSTKTTTTIKISKNSNRYKSIADDSCQPRKKFCFMDGCQPSYISRDDFVSDEAWGRFVKLMRYKSRQISAANKSSWRKGKYVSNLKELVKSLQGKNKKDAAE